MEALDVCNNDLSKSVQEEVLLCLLRLVDQAEHLSKEVVRISYSDITHANGRCILDILLRVAEQSLHSRHNSGLTAKINDLAILANSESTDNDLIGVLGSNHVPELVEDWLESSAVSNADGKASSSALALEVDEV